MRDMWIGDQVESPRPSTPECPQFVASPPLRGSGGLRLGRDRFYPHRDEQPPGATPRVRSRQRFGHIPKIFVALGFRDRP